MTDTELQEKLIDIVIKDKVPNFKLNRTENIGGQMARAKIEALQTLLQQSNREHGNWLIGLDELPQVLSSDPEKSIHPEVRNELRAKLRKKNAE